MGENQADFDNYWKIDVLSNTLLGDLHDGIQEFIEKIVKTELSAFPLEDSDIVYEESEQRKSLQDIERDTGRKLRNELLLRDKFMNVIIGNAFSVKLLKQYPHADFKVGPIRVFVFSAGRQ